MAYAEQTTTLRGPINEHATALSNHLSLVASLLLTALAVLLFRGLVNVIVRHFIPWPSLDGAGEDKTTAKSSGSSAARGLFSSQVESQQEGGNLLVLNPLPPQ